MSGGAGTANAGAATGSAGADLDDGVSYNTSIILTSTWAADCLSASSVSSMWALMPCRCHSPEAAPPTPARSSVSASVASAKRSGPSHALGGRNDLGGASLGRPQEVYRGVVRNFASKRAPRYRRRTLSDIVLALCWHSTGKAPVLHRHYTGTILALHWQWTDVALALH